MSASQPSHPYPEGTHVVIITWKGDEVGNANARVLASAWEEYGEVKMINEDVFEQKAPADIEIAEEKARWTSPYHYLLTEWLNEREGCDEVNREGPSKKLFVVCYLGHAGTEADGAPDEAGDQQLRLVASSDDKHPALSFDLTNDVKLLMRDNCASDSLLFFECCEGGLAAEYVPSEYKHPERIKARQESKVELLAAGGGQQLIYADGVDEDMARRLAKALRALQGPKTVKQLFDEELHRPDYSDAPGFHQDVGGMGSIVLQKTQH